MNSIIDNILVKGPEKQSEIVNDISKEINEISVLKFRSGTPNAASLPMPMEEIKKIKDDVIADVKSRVSDFFLEAEQEFNKLSEMACTETDDCCDKTIKQIQKIMNFTNEKNKIFKSITDDFMEYVHHLSPLLHMELLSKEDKQTLKNINQELDNNLAYKNQWSKLINGAKMKAAIVKLIKDKTELIIKFGEQVTEELQWVDQENSLISDKWEEMKTREKDWKVNLDCIRKLK